MKTLLLLRHAKSSWKDASLEDHDRPLNRRGKKAAPRMARLLREEGLRPDLIVSSTAVRAETTARVVADGIGDVPVELRKQLYLAEPERYISVLNELASDANTILMVGHNPGIEDLVNQLTGEDELMPTAALARVELPIEAWTDLRPTTRGSLVALWRPRELED